MSTGAVDLALRQAAMDALCGEGVLVMKLNRRVNLFTRRRCRVARVLTVSGAGSGTPMLTYHDPSRNKKEGKSFVIRSLQFAMRHDDDDDNDERDEICRSVRFNFVDAKDLRVVFGDVSTALNSFLAIQSLLPYDLNKDKLTREQLQCKISQHHLTKDLPLVSSKSLASSEEDNEITQLEPLFAYVFFSLSLSLLLPYFMFSLSLYLSLLHTHRPSGTFKKRFPEQHLRNQKTHIDLCLPGIRVPYVLRILCLSPSLHITYS